MTRLTKERLEEIWKDIPGCETQYQASSLGRIRTLLFVNNQARKILPEPKILAQIKYGQGYLKVVLYRKSKLVHRLILETFVGPCPPGHEAAHLNGISSDNTLTNLRWVTPKENHAHKAIHGTLLRGSQMANAKLTEHRVLEIRRAYSDGISQTEISKREGIPIGQINMIVHRRSWKHV